jgi:large subunit ribosomal protein L5
MEDTVSKTKLKSQIIANKIVPTTKARLYVQYNNIFVNDLQKELNLKNINEVPKLVKIVVNVGLGRARDDKKLMGVASNTLAKITGQKPIILASKLSIATFKLREGDKIGAKVTLRGQKMYEFMDRLINVVLPRLRDFHGVSNKAFDKQGNYSIGFIDQSVFPELSFEETSTAHGLQVTFIFEAKKTATYKSFIRKIRNAIYERREVKYV